MAGAMRWTLIMAGAAAAAAAMMLLAACGGNSGGGDRQSQDRLSQKEYSTRLNAICTDYNDFVDSVAAPNSMAEVGPWVDKLLPKFEETVSEARKLNPPADREAAANKFLSIGDQEAHLLEDVRAVAKDDDAEKVLELQRRGAKLDARSDELARQLGANDCATS